LPIFFKASFANDFVEDTKFLVYFFCLLFVALRDTRFAPTQILAQILASTDFACNNLQILLSITSNLEKYYVETFHGGRQVSFRKYSPSTSSPNTTIPAGGVRHPCGRPPIPVETPVIPTAAHRPSKATPDGVQPNINLLETRSLHFAHSALMISRAMIFKACEILF
jgi:hypothetical protein